MAEARSLVFEGWAWKQGKVNKAFRRRFFKLFSDGYVAYYAAIDASKPKGYFQLTAESRAVLPEELLPDPILEDEREGQDQADEQPAKQAADAAIANGGRGTGSSNSSSRKGSALARSTGSSASVVWPKNSQPDARLSIVTAKRTFFLQLDTVGKRTDFHTHFSRVIDGLQPLREGDEDEILSESEESSGRGARMRRAHARKLSEDVNIEDTHEYKDEMSDMDHPETSEERSEFFQRPYHKVIVVGAGLAGLAAVKHLRETHGILDVLVLEATPRIGGRVQPLQLPSLPKVYLDAGACELYGQHGHEMEPLLKASGCDTFDLADIEHRELDVGIACEGNPVDEEAIEDAMDTYANIVEDIRDDVEAVHTAHEDRGKPLPRDRNVAWRLARGIRTHPTFKQLEQESRLLLGYFRTRQEVVAGAPAAARSLNAVLEREPLPGNPLLVRDTARAVHDLGQDAHIRFNQPVTHIAEEKNTVHVNDKEVTAHMKVRNRQGRDYLCDFVLVTVPISELQTRAISFDPPLPEEKTAAIDRIGFGLVNKIYLHFPKAFWDDKKAPELLRDKEVLVNLTDFPDPSRQHQPHELVPIHYVNYHKAFGVNVLVGMVVGSYAATLEALTEEDVAPLLAQELRQMFPDATEEETTPLSCKMTRWSRHPHIHGAASYIKVKHSAEDMDVYAAPAPSTTGSNPRLFFAGEATERCHHGTMHGALVSGKKQIDRMVASMLHTTVNVTGASSSSPTDSVDVSGTASQTDV